MTGIEFATVRDTIARCFTADEFDMFLYEKLDFDRTTEVADGPFKVVVTNVLKQFQNRGTDPFLIAEVAAERPMRSDVWELYKKYASVMVSEAQDGKVEGERARALERFGLAPVVDFQTGGQRQLRRPASSANEGFQRQIRSALGVFDPLPWMKGLFEQTSRVCQVEVNGGGTLGTGFLVGPDAVLTNHHVVASLIGSKAPSLTCLFDYRQRPDGWELEGNRVGVAADWLIDASPPLTDAQEETGEPEPDADHLDHALIRLARPIGAESRAPGEPVRGWVRVPDTAPQLVPHMPLLILQHPKGEPVKLAMDTDSVQRVNASGTRVRHTTNTDDGSSGAPCFNLKWQLVALHHYGEPVKKATFNQGVPIAAIRRRLEKEKKQAALGQA